MVCHGEHTYLYTQILLHTLSQESKGGPRIKRLGQELQNHAKLKYDIYILVYTNLEWVFIVVVEVLKLFCLRCEVGATYASGKTV